MRRWPAARFCCWLIRLAIGWGAYWLWLLAPECLAVRRGRLHETLLPHIGFYMFDDGFTAYRHRQREREAREWTK